jgi:hypothetical protein
MVNFKLNLMAKFWVNLVVKPNGYIQLLNLGRWVGK